jgi:uncharacterized damage-inducible protein DinB
MSATHTETAPTGQNLTPAEFLFTDLEQELAATRRVLERFPEGKGDWRPHEKSRTLGELATHVAELSGLGAMVLQAPFMDVTQRQKLSPANSASELLAIFDERAARLRNAVASVDFEALEQPWSFRRGDQVVFSAPRRAMLRTLYFNHIIHHRAQLGVYYRLLGVPVPITYGPTADEAF